MAERFSIPDQKNFERGGGGKKKEGLRVLPEKGSPGIHEYRRRKKKGGGKEHRKALRSIRKQRQNPFSPKERRDRGRLNEGKGKGKWI